MNAQVVCHVRAGVTLTFKLKEKDAVIGRDPLNAIAVPVEGVSRHHAKIRWDGKAYWVEDIRSTNGTFLNGQAAVRERLSHLDVISLGREVDLVFLARAAEVPASRQGIVRAALVAEGDGGAAIAISAGEVTLGRSPSNNVVADSSAVSKVHARIERTLDQLVLEDLGSANGTYVNGARVMTAFLQDGDVLSLAGVDTFRVVVEMGEVKGFSTSARMKAPVTPGARQRFAADWRTRFEWDSGEQRQLEELRRQIREREKVREQQRGRTKKVDVVKAPGHPARPAGAAKAAPGKPTAAAKPVSAPTPVASAKPASAPTPASPAMPVTAAKPAAAASPASAAGPAPAAASAAAASGSPKPAATTAPSTPATGTPGPPKPVSPGPVSASSPATPPSPKPAAISSTPSGGAAPGPAAPSPAMPRPERPAPTPPAAGASASASAAPTRPAAMPSPSEPAKVVAPSPAAGAPGPARAAVPPGTPATPPQPTPVPPAAPALPVASPASVAPPPPASSPRPDPTEAFARSLTEPPPAPTVVAHVDAADKTVAFSRPGSGPRPGSILEVRLRAEGYDLVASEPGAHELGRATDAPLRVNHSTVSRKHARIILADDRGIAYLQDAGGANGTRLNDKPIEKLAPLSDGDRIGIGEVELKVTLKRA